MSGSKRGQEYVIQKDRKCQWLGVHVEGHFSAGGWRCPSKQVNRSYSARELARVKATREFARREVQSRSMLYF